MKRKLKRKRMNIQKTRINMIKRMPQKRSSIERIWVEIMERIETFIQTTFDTNAEMFTGS